MPPDNPANTANKLQHNFNTRKGLGKEDTSSQSGGKYKKKSDTDTKDKQAKNKSLIKSKSKSPSAKPQSGAELTTTYTTGDEIHDTRATSVAVPNPPDKETEGLHLYASANDEMTRTSPVHTDQLAKMEDGEVEALYTTVNKKQNEKTNLIEDDDDSRSPSPVAPPLPSTPPPHMDPTDVSGSGAVGMYAAVNSTQGMVAGGSTDDHSSSNPDGDWGDSDQEAMMVTNELYDH